MGKIGILCLILLSVSVHSKPEVNILQALDHVFISLQQLKNQELDDYKNVIASHISPHIDTLSMSQLILGRHWKRASIQQKKRFMSCFTRQLRTTQAQAFFNWKPTHWELLQQTFNENRTKVVLVMALTQPQESREFTLRLHLVDNQWLIYDAAYLGISLLKNFKDDYALKIKNQGLSKTLAQVCQQYPETIRQLTLAGTQWPPFTSRNLPGKGLGVEIVKAVLTRAGYEVSMVFVPWKRVMQGMKQGEYDINVTTWKSKKRQKYLHFSEPYFSNELVAVYHKESTPAASTLDEALSHGSSLGLMDDYAYGSKIQQYPNRRYFAQYNILFRSLMSKDLDFSLLDRHVAQFYLDRSTVLKNSLQVATITLEAKPLHISMIKQHPAANEVISDFNRYLKMYLKSNEYQALLTRYQLNNNL
jgi:polar amino acid transport system substrate-binding protein